MSRPANLDAAARPARRPLLVLSLVSLTLATANAGAQVAVRGEVVHTMAGAPIRNGVVLVRDGRIEDVGGAGTIVIPDDYTIIEAPVVTPGFIDAHSAVGLTGYLNQDQDQDQLDRTSAMQPELRALDAYNPGERLVEWVRGLGVTTLHTGHAPGALISGQTMIVKTAGNTVEDAVRVPAAMVAATLGDDAKGRDGKSPGTRGKAVALLRQAFIEARERQAKITGGEDVPPDLSKDALVQVLDGKLPLLVTVHQAQDIMTALRLKEEFGFRLVLDGAAEAYLVLDAIKASGVPVIVHPPMVRTRGATKNATFELAHRLHDAGIPIAFQSGFESYVPKTRVVVFEAAIAAANGLGRDATLAALTRGAATLLGIEDRVGTLEPGKEADLALFTDDPLETTTRCLGVVIDGKHYPGER